MYTNVYYIVIINGFNFPKHWDVRAMGNETLFGYDLTVMIRAVTLKLISSPYCAGSTVCFGFLF